MTPADIGEILANELGKISEPIIYACIIIAIALVVLGLLIRGFKNVLRKIFK